ncbi:hypothetical protein M422DRAFT_246814 [Sphaerobolus stellatus SS14]|nr:hypothetical protein M422DRAFT_246814 [Sphaerobolus stellatus SS14]
MKPVKERPRPRPLPICQNPKSVANSTLLSGSIPQTPPCKPHDHEVIIIEDTPQPSGPGYSFPEHCSADTQFTSRSQVGSLQAYLPDGTPKVGDTFSTLDAAMETIINFEESCGNKMVIRQSKKDGNGSYSKVIMCCNGFQKPQEVYNLKINPSDCRKSKSIKIDCKVHYNLNHV